MGGARAVVRDARLNPSRLLGWQVGLGCYGFRMLKTF
jgi:hypothetical protein